MAEAFNLLRRVKSLDISPEQPAYSGVVIFAGQDEEGNNIEYSAGDRTGTVLEITNEWGSQAQADAIYQKIRGFQYQPYRATGSQLDPSVEIGDAVTVKDTYGGVFKKATSFGRYASTDIEAPSKEEVEHEFQIQSPTNRQYERFTRSVRASLSITASQIAAEVEDRKAEDNLLRATLNIQAQEIEAKVSKEGGDDASDFWWKLLSTGWDVGTGSKTVFSVKKNGAYVDGEIRSTTGKIGNWDINANGLSYNGQTWGGTNSTGAYIGQSGIQLGKNFKVDMQGNLSASSGTFSGNVYAGNIQYGGSAGYMSGGGISGGSIQGNRMVANTISTDYTSEGINASLGFADFANGVFNGYNTARQIACTQLSASEILLGGKILGRSTIGYMGSDGKAHAINVVTWSTR